jgi:hypothetical protein
LFYRGFSKFISWANWAAQQIPTNHFEPNKSIFGLFWPISWAATFKAENRKDRKQIHPPLLNQAHSCNLKSGTTSRLQAIGRPIEPFFF